MGGRFLTPTYLLQTSVVWLKCECCPVLGLKRDLHTAISFPSTHGIVALSLPLLNSCERHWFFKVKVKWIWNFILVSWPVLGGSLILLVTSYFGSFREKNSKNSLVSWKNRQRASTSGLGLFFWGRGENHN